MDTKALSGLKIDDADQGTVTAVFATLNVVDHDGDVTPSGAFSEGAGVRISAYNHESWKGALPVGKGTIREVGNEAVMHGQFFLDTAGGRDTFAVVKQLGELMEWSYGYDPVEFSYGEHDGDRVRFLNRVKVHEVSPVILGAGLNTRTLAAKSRDMKLTDHAAAVLADVDGLTERVAEVMARRAEKGKGLGSESADLVARLDSSLTKLSDLLAGQRDDDDTADELVREYARFARAIHR